MSADTAAPQRRLAAVAEALSSSSRPAPSAGSKPLAQIALVGAGMWA
eukprot:COSAG03_NODE_7539_length_903_cov_2.238806_1_plen_46_part_10